MSRRTQRPAPSEAPSGAEAAGATAPAPRPPCLGLTGGIGSGKSAALAAFARLGAGVLSADEVVHAILRRPEVAAEIAERFGDGVLTRDGVVDRELLGPRVFGDPEALRDLEAIIHPRVENGRREWIAAQSSLVPPPPLLVCEVPLLYEVGLEATFDAVLVVTASTEVRRTRVEARGQRFAERSGRQVPEEEKVARADHVLHNEGSLDAVDEWARSIVALYADPRADGE